MKRTMLSVLAIIASCMVYADVSIIDVTAQQRYQWNGKVDISYTVVGDVSDRTKDGKLVATLKVAAIDIATSTTNIATKLSGDIAVTEGTHKIVWDMREEGLDFKSTSVVFDVSCEERPALYCVVDLSAGSAASSYPCSYINEIPSGGWGEEYATTKLALRYIPAGSFIMGEDQSDVTHKVVLTKPFYMGVFETTGKQYWLITGEKRYTYELMMPVGGVSYNSIRGESAGSQWPMTTAVDDDSFMGKMRKRTNLDFDLPTEAQWEYACRAGTTTAYSYGADCDGEYMWYSQNSGDQRQNVGARLSNPWGLYDMHGNNFEFCVDWYSDTLAYGIDPKGVSVGTAHVRRGGSYHTSATSCKSSYRGSNTPEQAYVNVGFRVALPLSDNGLCTTGRSKPVSIDLAKGTRIAASTELLSYSTSWIKGATEDATSVIIVDGVIISENHGTGTVTWMPCYGVHTLTHKVVEDGVQLGATLSATFNAEWMSVEAPTIGPDSGSFANVSQEVTLSCETEGATIYYTIDGSEPSVANGRKYKGPFDIYQTTVVKAIAVKDDWKDSAVASATFTKANAIGPAINLLEVLPDNDMTHPWEVVTDVTHDGVSAIKSGAIEDEESTTVKAVIYGAGELSFWWKSSCEPSIGGEYYDYGTFYNGTTAVTNIAGVTDWQQVRLVVSGTGKHTFKWTYQKDDSGSTVPDGIWLDQVQWLPETTDYYADHTLTTETPVEYKWLRKYGLGVTNDFEAAAKAKTGKRDGAGRELTVEDDYIAGTDPTNMTSQLTSKIEMIDGVPNITWNPDLEGDRTYKIWGSTNLVNGGEWEYPTNSLHRFFKVTVEMP